MATVFERVKTIIADKVDKDPEEITEQSILKPGKPDEEPSPHSLGTDSLDVVEMVMACEAEFFKGEREITDDELANISTIGELVAWLKEQGVRD